MSQHYGAKISTAGLVCLLDSQNSKSYPGSGSIWYDLSGNGNNGTLNGFTGPGAGTTSGWDSNTGLMMFDRHSGSSDATANNRVVISNNNILDNVLITNGMTINFWMKMTTYACTAMTKWNGSWEIYYCPSLVWRSQGTGGSDGGTGLSYTSYLNNFHMITATHNGSTRKFYINGDSYYSNSNVVSTQDTTNNISIGGYENGQYATIGSIPYYMLYNRVLNDNEIKQIYNSTQSRFGSY